MVCLSPGSRVGFSFPPAEHPESLLGLFLPLVNSSLPLSPSCCGCKSLLLFCLLPDLMRGFPGGSAVKNPPVKAGDIRDVGSINGMGRSPGEMATYSSILAWEILWME